MNIRSASMQDIEEISAIENECFPPEQACTREQFQQRLTYYPEHFWLLEKDGEIISFVDGFCTDEETLTDEMYEKAEMHNEAGKVQMIFGVNTLPAYRKKGYGSQLIQKVIKDILKKDKNAIIELHAQYDKQEFYQKLGFAPFKTPFLEANIQHIGMRYQEIKK